MPSSDTITYAPRAPDVRRRRFPGIMPGMRSRVGRGRWTLTGISFVLVLLLWELGTRLGVLNSDFVGTPTGVAGAGIELLPTAAFWNDARVTGTELALGYGAAVVVGVPLGLICGLVRRLGYMVAPWLDAFNATPTIALLPAVILWLGIGLMSKAAIVFLPAVGLIFMNTFHGVRTTRRDLLEVARVFGASRARRLVSVVLPACLPFVFTGLRLGLGAAVVGVLFSELYGANEGLGHSMTLYARTLQTSKYLFVVVTFVAVGLVLYASLGALERRVTRWAPRRGT